VLEDLGRPEEAAQALRDGIELAERLGHVEEVGGCLINLGLLQLSLGDLEEAVRCDEQALEHFTRVGHVLGQVTAAGNLAEKLGQAGRITEAMSWCDRAERGALELGDRIVLADLVRTRAQLLLVQGDRTQAVAHATRSAQLFDEIGATAEADEARAVLRRALEEAGGG
jgi:tetratricopeptide (TPR) repeat protein